MSKLNRLMWTGLVLVGAACGDDVTVTPPPPPPEPGVRSVTVAPDGANVLVGQTLQMTAAVTVDPGATAAPTIAWSSSDNTKATVSNTGLVTGVAVGSVGIRATATLGTSSAQGVATVNVITGPQPPGPPTISISGITNTVVGTGEVPVNLAAVAGQINVALNLERNQNPISEVQLLMDTETGDSIVARQTFAAASAPAEGGPQLVPELLTLSINTANFNPTTGKPSFINRLHTLKARAFIVGSTTGPAATNSVQFTLANANTAAITVVIENGSSATASNGALWWTGDAVATALPVIYSTANPTIAQVAFAPTGGLAGKVATTAPYTVRWNKGTTIGNGGSGGNNALGVEDGNFTVGVSATINGNPTGTLATSTAIRYDNNGPGAPTFVANPNGRRNGWINATVGLTGLNTSATDNDWLVNGAADAGVGGYTRRLRIGTGGGTVANALAAAASATPTLPAPSPNNLPTAYCAVASATDALGNESLLPTSGTVCLIEPSGVPFVATGSTHLSFGVDIYAPVATYDVTSLANQARLNGGSIGGEFVVTVNDTGSVGNSGMLAGSPVISNVIRRTAAGTVLPGDCVQGTMVSGVCTQSSVGLGVALPLVSTGITAQTTAGYYSHTAKALDAAGNSTDVPDGRVIVYDASPATATNPAVPVTITGAFSAAAFLNDNLSIRDYYYTVGFGGPLITPATVRLALAPTVVDAFNAPTLTHTNFAINTTVNTYLGLQATNPGNVPAAYAAGANPLNALNLFVRDQTQAAYTGPASAVIAPTAPATGIAITNVNPAWNFNLFTPATTNATICAGQAGAPACGATPATTVWTAVASGTTATFPNPFSRVDFYAADATGTDLVLIGSVPAAAASTNDNGAVRTHTYSLSVSALSLYNTLGGVVPAVVGPVNVYAFGVNAAGNVALVSLAITQTINP